MSYIGECGHPRTVTPDGHIEECARDTRDERAGWLRGLWVRLAALVGVFR